MAEDITKTGIKGVRNPDLYSEKKEAPIKLNTKGSNISYGDSYLNRVASRRESIKSGNLGSSGWQDPALFKPQHTGELGDFGTSVWDDEYIFNPDETSVQDQRANNQWWPVKAGAGILKGVGLAATTFIDGTAGLIYGIGKAFHDKEFNPIWNNEITQAMDWINRKMDEEWLPNYYTYNEQVGPWYKNMGTANFIFDKFIKNLGFTIGAAYSGGFYTKIISWGAKAIGGIKGLMASSQALGASTKLGGINKGIQGLWKGGEFGAETAKAFANGAKAFNELNATRFAKSATGVLLNATAEGMVEAVSNSNEYIRANTRELEQWELEQKMEIEAKYANDPEGRADAYEELSKEVNRRLNAINETAKNMGNSIFALNLPILAFGDWLTFAKMYAGGWRAARNSAKTKVRAVKETLKAAKETAKNGDKTALQHIREVIAKVRAGDASKLTPEEKALVEIVGGGNTLGAVTKGLLRGPLKEGNEEMAQRAVATGSTYYYNEQLDRIWEGKNDPEATDTISKYLSSIWQGIADTYTDSQAYEEGAIGFLTGLLGVPTFGRVSNSINQTVLGRGKPVGLTGGLYTEIRDAINKNRDNRKVAEKVNEAFHNPNIQEGIKHLVAQHVFSNDKDDAALRDSKKDYKDAETAAIFEDIMYFKRADRLDLLKSMINAQDLIDDASIEEIIKETTARYSAVNSRVDELVAGRDNSAKKIDEITESINTLTAKENEIRQQIETEDSEQNLALLESQLQEVTSKKQELQVSLDKEQTTFDNTSKLIEQSKTKEINPFLKRSEDGTSSLMTNEEIKEDILKRASRYKEMIDDVASIQDEIDKATGQSLTDEQLTTLTWYRAQMKNWEQRALDMGLDLSPFVKTLTENPVIKNMLEAYEEYNNLEDNPAGALPESLEGAGGFIEVAIKVAKLSANYMKILQDIVLKSDKKTLGINFANALNSDRIITKKAEKEDQESNSESSIEEENKQDSNKEDVNKESDESHDMTLGDFLVKLLKTSIAIDPNLQGNLPKQEELFQKIEDLKLLGNQHAQYNKLLIEYLTTPSKIDEAHTSKLALDAKRFTNKIRNKKVNALIDRINWDGPIDDIREFFEENEEEIESVAGSIPKFLKYLTKEQREKAIKALKLSTFWESLQDSINDSDISEGAQSILEYTLQDMDFDDPQAITDGVNKKLQDPEYPKELAKYLSVDEETAIKLMEEANGFLDDAISDALESSDISEEDLIKKLNEKYEKEEKEIEKIEDEKLEDFPIEDKEEKEKKKDDTPKKRGRKPKKTDEKEDKETKPISKKDKKALDNLNEENKDKQNLSKDEKELKNNKKVAPIKQGQKFYGNRPQLSEAYLHSTDLVSYAEVIKEAFARGELLGILKDIKDKELIVTINTQPFSTSNNKNYRDALQKAGILNKGEIVPGHITNWTREESPGSLLTLLQAKTLRSKIRSVFEKQGTIQQLHDAIVNGTSVYTSAPMPVLESLYKTLEAIKSGKITVEEAMEYAESFLYTEEKLSQNKEGSTTDSEQTTAATQEKVTLSKQGYVTYINAVHEELVDKGAFDYVSQRLTEGDELTLKYDEALSKKAGVPIVAIYAGNQLVGTIKTLYEFDVYQNSLNKKKLENGKLRELTQEEKEELRDISVEEQQALYEFLINNRDKVATTKVDNLMAGNLAIASSEKSLETIFKDTKQSIKLAVITNNGIIASPGVETNNIHIDMSKVKPGQTYVLIPANNGMYLPALVYTTQLAELDKKDPQIQNILDVIKQLDTTEDINKIWSNVAIKLGKVLPVSNIHIDYVNKSGKEETNVNTLAEANKVKIKFTATNKKGEKSMGIVYIPVTTDNHLTEDSIYNALMKELKRFKLSVNLNKANITSDPNYPETMASYIFTNLVSGSKGVHTINDWFTYNPDIIEKDISEQGDSKAKEVKEEGKKRQNKKRDKKEGTSVKKDSAKPVEEKQISDGKDVTVNPDGIKTDDDTGAVVEDKDKKEKKRKLVPPNQVTPKKSKLAYTEQTAAEQRETEKELQDAIDLCTKLFPKLDVNHRIAVVNSIIRTVDENGNPVKAFGLFKNGVIYVAKNAPKGTVFHEAFHYITEFLLTDNEKSKLFKAAKQKFGDLSKLELEERTAESFRQFMNEHKESAPITKSFWQRVKSMFSKLKSIITGVSNRGAALDRLFYSIYNGKMANRRELSTAELDKNPEYFEVDFMNYRLNKTDYGNLDMESKRNLALRDISQEDYENLSLDQKEALLRCM